MILETCVLLPDMWRQFKFGSVNFHANLIQSSWALEKWALGSGDAVDALRSELFLQIFLEKWNHELRQGKHDLIIDNTGKVWKAKAIPT